MSVQIGLIVFLHYSLFQQQSYFHIYYLHSIINQQLFEFLAYIKRCCMGNKNQKVQENRQTFSSQIKHPKLSHAKVIKPHSQNQQPYLELAQSVQNRQIYEKWKLRAMKYSVDPSQIQMILIPRAILFEEKGICGSSGIIKSQYIMLPYVLSEEIDNRAILKQPFLEKQLWYLIYILNAAGSLAHSRGLILGDVRPENVLMSFDGQICVCCLETFLDQQKNYTKTMRLKMKTFLAPEQIKDLQEGKSQPATDQKISESFSIGLTILSAILLKDLTYLYGQDYTFNERSLQSQVSNMKNRTQYSQNLKSLVESLVQINPKQRLQSVEAVQILRPYEQEIVNLEDFQLEKATIPTQIKGKLKNAQNIGVRSGRNNSLSKVINNNDFNKNSRINYEARTNDLSKVINNNDFNKNSRVQYDVSPRMSNNALHQQVKFQFPTINGGKPQQLQFKAGNNYVVGSNPKQYNQKSNNQEPQIVLTQSLYTQIPHLNGFQPGQQLANNYSQIQSQRPIESKVIQSTSYNRPQLNGFPQRTDQVPITIQYPPVGTLPMHYVNKNQVQANQMFYQNPIQVTNSNVVHNLNQPYRIPSQISNQYLNVQGSNLNSMPVSGIASGIKTPEVFSYGSRFQSNIEDFEHPKQIIHKQQTKNVETYLSKPNSYYSKPQPEITINRQIHGNNSINTPTFPTRKLEQLGREVNSIRPPPDKIFQTYEQAMKNLDDKLKQSKTMFPDDP